MNTRIFILMVFLVLLTAASCSKKEDTIETYSPETNETENNIVTNTPDINDNEKSRVINIPEFDIIMISNAISSSLAYIDNIADINKIVELFEDERLTISSLTLSPSSLVWFIVSFYSNDSSESVRTIYVYDNMHLKYREGNHLYNYTIDDDNVTIYDDIRGYYDKYKQRTAASTAGN